MTIERAAIAYNAAKARWRWNTALEIRNMAIRRFGLEPWVAALQEARKGEPT